MGGDPNVSISHLSSGLAFSDSSRAFLKIFTFCGEKSGSVFLNFIKSSICFLNNSRSFSDVNESLGGIGNMSKIISMYSSSLEGTIKFAI